MSKTQLLESTVSSEDKELLLHLYEKMLLIRQFELRVERLFAAGKLPGFVHLYSGQEAVAVGVCSALNRDDFITSTHRGHGHTIAKGGDVRRMMAELYGKSTGYCKGKGGSMHITDMAIGMLGANGIVAGGVPMAVGAAYGAAKIRKTNQVAVPFFGDGATNEGAFHEAANMASAWDLPVIFACENNLYGVGTRLDRVSVTEEVSVRASGYSIPAVTVDGNDVLAVRKASLEAVARARAGEGPTFLECKTWRHKGHFEGEVVNYWDEDELAEWQKRDPIKLLAKTMKEAGIVTEVELDAIAESVADRIDDAVNFAEASPMPDPEDALDDLYV